MSVRSPPEPPDGEEPDGGALGMITVISGPVRIVLTKSSCGNGTGVRSALSIVQFNAIVQDVGVSVILEVQGPNDVKARLARWEEYWNFSAHAGP